jgi:hypothetical protein
MALADGHVSQAKGGVLMREYRVRRGGTIRIDIALRRRQEAATDDAGDESRSGFWNTPARSDLITDVQGKVTLIITFTSDKTTIGRGQQVTFSYSVKTHTITLVLRDLNTGADTALYAGTQAVTPADPPVGQTQVVRSYKLIADGPYGHHEERTIAITVKILISSFTAPASVNWPNTIALTYATSGATSANIRLLPSGSPTSVSLPSGTVNAPSVEPPTDQTQHTTSYRLTANASGGVTETKDVSVIVRAAQRINSFTATPSTITAGQTSTLAYNCAHATLIKIKDLTSGVETTVSGQAGTLGVTPATTRTYRLTVSGLVADITQDVVVTVNP